jgi:hypothetical protein
MESNITLRSGVGEDVVPEWITCKEMLKGRLGFKDTNSDNSGSEGLGEETHTLWMLW